MKEDTQIKISQHIYIRFLTQSQRIKNGQWQENNGNGHFLQSINDPKSAELYREILPRS